MKWTNSKDYTRMDYKPIRNDGLYLWLIVVLFIVSLFIH